MTAAAPADCEYNDAELAILQQHLDFYRGLPEIQTLTGFLIKQTGSSVEACRSLARRGLMIATEYGSERIRKKIPDDPAHPDYDVAMRSSHEKGWDRSGQPTLTYFQDVPPGVEGQLTEAAIPEVIRLFKARILKKNDV